MLEERECTDRCKCTKHGEIVCATLTKRSVLDSEVCAYLQHICCSCESVKDTSGRTALHVAASCGRINTVKWLTRVKHANINAKDNESGYTPLHRSIFYGKLDVAVFLIKLGANTGLTDFDGLTSLEHAMKDFGKSSSTSHDLSQAEVYVWGSNANYVLGPQQARLVPELLDAFHKEHPNLYVEQVCLEKFHCVLVTTDGTVFACGHGQGGRLGLPSEKSIMSPTLVKFNASGHSNPIICKRASIALDHSIFLTESGHIWTCGLNTHRVLGLQPPPAQILVPTPLPLMQHTIQNICAARFHSIAWGPKAIFTWGLHGGQLGHDKSPQKYVVTPKLVTCLFGLDNTTIKSVAASSSATAIVTSKGDIYVLHEYQCRKIASRQLNIVSISVIGGKINEKIDNTLKSEENHELKVVGLSNVGNLYVWTETDPQFARCIFSINRSLKIRQISLNLNEILLVTHDGEAFQGTFKPRKRKTTETSPQVKKSSFHEFLEKDNCQLVKVTKIARIHRAVSICSDFKGRNYAVLQASPKAFITKVPQVSGSVMQENMYCLLKETSDDDAVHDVIFKVANRLFPAHRYIIACSSTKLGDVVAASIDTIIDLANIPSPAIFEQLLLFIYTGTCDILKLGKLPENLQLSQNKNKEDQEEIQEDYKQSDLKNISAFEYYKNMKSKSKTSNASREENSKDPVRMLQEIAKRFEVKALQKLLDGVSYCDGCIVMKKQTKKVLVPKFGRAIFPELYDVVLKTKDGKKVKAHRCILAARLDYFNNLFSSRWSESFSSKEISFPFPYSVLDQLIEFLYTDELPLLENEDIDQVCNLLIVSDQLFVLRLKEICECTLSTFVTLKNVVQLLSFAYRYNADQLKVYCMEFICLNLASILESRTLELVEDELLSELATFYCDYNPVMQQRIITPYSYAPADELLALADSMHHILLDDSGDEQETEPKTNIIKPQKRRTRTRKNSSTSDANTKKSLDCSSDGIQIINELNDHDINHPETPETSLIHSNESPSNKIQNRVRAILIAQDKIDCDNLITEEYTKFPLTDFPELNNHHIVRTSHSKSPTKSDVIIKQKFTKLSQRRKRLLSENSLNAKESTESNPPVLSESPRNPWKIPPLETNSPVGSPEMLVTINSIITDEKRQKENLVKMRTKLLIHTQMEDKAIEDLFKFYNVDHVFDEIISIERVQIGSVASPVWVHMNKTK